MGAVSGCVVADSRCLQPWQQCFSRSESDTSADTPPVSSASTYIEAFPMGAPLADEGFVQEHHGYLEHSRFISKLGISTQSFKSIVLQIGLCCTNAVWLRLAMPIRNTHSIDLYIEGIFAAFTTRSRRVNPGTNTWKCKHKLVSSCRRCGGLGGSPGGCVPRSRTDRSLDFVSFWSWFVRGWCLCSYEFV